MGELTEVRTSRSALGPTTGLVGDSQALEAVRRQILVAAQYGEPTLIVGETGTGKEVVARAIHALGPRGRRPLQVVNCGAVPDDVLTAELFGHRAGAFTGASKSRRGRVRCADGSSLFLDEVSETSRQFQVALLRVVEEGEIQPVGEDMNAERVDVRFIAATNRPLAELESDGSFRTDLLYRLSSFLIRVPPLRERVEDIPSLVGHFCRQLGKKYHTHWRFTAAATALLRDYEFPGNVRELRQIVFAACVSSGSGRVSAGQVSRGLGRHTGSWSRRHVAHQTNLALEPLLRQHLRQTILVAEGNLSKAARLLEIPRSTLQHMLVRHDIDIEKLRGETLEPGATPMVAREIPYASLGI